jgi:hypothetical protein
VSNRAQAGLVLEAALSGGLSLEEFHRAWPEHGDPLIDVIFEETEDTVEHTPGSLLRRADEHERLRESVPYKILIVDQQLLSDEFSDVPSHSLVAIRERLLKELDLYQDHESLARSARDFVARETT